MLHANTIDRALNVGAEPGESVGRAVIDGCVVTYDLDAPPRWLALLLADRDEDGNTDEFAPKRISDLEAAWGLISNAWNGNWEDAPVEWQEAAKRWRDEAWHPALDGPPVTIPDPFPTSRKHVAYVGRWRIAIMRNGPYRSGWRYWSREHFDFALPWFCVSMLRRSSRAR